MTTTTPLLFAAALPFVSSDFLRFMETQGLAGAWSWTFAPHLETWSPSLVRLCGLPADALPTYDLLLDLAHPDDRPGLDSRSDIRDRGVVRDHTFRIIRPDGTLRVLSSRGEVFFDADGQPRSAVALVVDVTERAPRARAGDECRPADRDDAARLGPGDAEPRSRGAAAVCWCAAPRPAAMIGGLGGHAATLAADGLAPSAAHGDDGPDTRCGEPGRRPPLDIRSEHLRAARTLLGWSMTDLAKASCLSLSTIRRLESDVHGPGPRNLRCVLDVMRHAGVRFVLTEADVIAVGKS